MGIILIPIAKDLCHALDVPSTSKNGTSDKNPLKNFCFGEFIYQTLYYL